MNTLSVSVRAVGASQASGRALDDLARLARQSGLSVEEVRETAIPGQKDFGLTVGLAITGLAVNAIGILISALAFWRDRHPLFSAAVTAGDLVLTVETVDPEQLDKLVAALRKAALSPERQAITVAIGEDETAS